MIKKGTSTSAIESLVSHTIKKANKRDADRNKNEDHSKEQLQLYSQLDALKEAPQLEEFGSSLTAQEFSIILKLFHEERIPSDKLLPLLVGLKSNIFAETMHHIQDIDLTPLKQEGLLEPLQHHLKEFIAGSKLHLKNLSKTTGTLNQEIDQLSSDLLTKQTIHLLYSKIEHVHGEYLDLIHTIDKILAIAWKNDREDIIEELNELKHNCLWQLSHVVGTKDDGNLSPSSLYAHLEEKLLSIYDKNNEGIDEIERLNDTDLSIDGLTKLSIWYLKDYWEIGLLPSIKNVKDLELDLLHIQEKNRLEHRMMLFELVQKNLSKIGLATVGDLKKERIFSKKILKDYIQKQKNLL